MKRNLIYDIKHNLKQKTAIILSLVMTTTIIPVIPVFADDISEDNYIVATDTNDAYERMPCFVNTENGYEMYEAMFDYNTYDIYIPLNIFRKAKFDNIENIEMAYVEDNDVKQIEVVFTKTNDKKFSLMIWGEPTADGNYSWWYETTNSSGSRIHILNISGYVYVPYSVLQDDLNMDVYFDDTGSVITIPGTIYEDDYIIDDTDYTMTFSMGDFEFTYSENTSPEEFVQALADAKVELDKIDIEEMIKEAVNNGEEIPDELKDTLIDYKTFLMNLTATAEEAINMVSDDEKIEVFNKYFSTYFMSVFAAAMYIGVFVSEDEEMINDLFDEMLEVDEDDLYSEDEQLVELYHLCYDVMMETYNETGSKKDASISLLSTLLRNYKIPVEQLLPYNYDKYEFEPNMNDGSELSEVNVIPDECS